MGPQAAASSVREDRLGLALASIGGGLAVLAALVLWQSEGAAIFLTGAVTAVMTCF